MFLLTQSKPEGRLEGPLLGVVESKLSNDVIRSMYFSESTPTSASNFLSRRLPPVCIHHCACMHHG